MAHAQRPYLYIRFEIWRYDCISRPRIPIILENFGDSSIITHIFIAHVQNGHISTSSLNSDITIVFLNPDFLQDWKNFGDLQALKQI